MDTPRNVSQTLLKVPPSRLTDICRYARDLEHFVKLLDFTPMEAIVASTAGVAKLFMREHELGKIKEGYYADCILVDGNPLDDIKILQVPSGP